jgi:hypothetical protein
MFHAILLVTGAFRRSAVPTAPSRTRENVRRYRERMRAKGFRQIQLWVPDTRLPGFVAECRRQSLLVATDPAEHSPMDELEALQANEDWQP